MKFIVPRSLGRRPLSLLISCIQYPLRIVDPQPRITNTRFRTEARSLAIAIWSIRRRGPDVFRHL